MRKVYFTFLVFIILMVQAGAGWAQTDFRVQSVFLYNFTRLIAWPADYQTGDFIVAVYGSSPMMAEVETMASTRKAGTQDIVARNFNSVSEITRCHIIYVPSNQSRSIQEIVDNLKAKNIKALVVTDSRNAVRNGAVVNFTIVDNRQRFELSQANAAAMGLTLGAEIARLAIMTD